VADVIELDYSSDWNVAIKDWKGRGGTDMRPAFEHAATLKPQGLICLSDMEIGAFPDAPRFPVFWLATRDHEKPPYGEMSILTVK
jgi:predicted metal-dependent peptidase